MVKATGIHHIAIATGDLKGQLEFFTHALGMELVALYPMHGVPGVIHAFVKGSGNCHVAFAYHEDVSKIPVEFGVTHAGTGAEFCSPGVVQHIALDVATEEELLAMRDRIRLAGVNVFGPLDHGFCKSIYFAGPENLTLEVAFSEQPIDARQWIDPEMLTLAGISAADAERFKAPADLSSSTPVAQPDYDATKPHMHIPEEAYKNLLKVSDADYTARFSETTPPVPLPA